MNIKKPEINWTDFAISMIECSYECPLCDFKAYFSSRVEDHIRSEHTPQQIKEICSQ